VPCLCVFLTTGFRHRQHLCTMRRNVLTFIAFLAVLSLQSFRVSRSQTQSSSRIVLYEGARLIPGDGRPPVASSAMLVENGIITKVGPKGSVTAPAGALRIDLSGKTLMPALIDAHVHPGFQRGLTYTGENFTRETIINDLNRALYFGVAVVQSQGIEK